VALNPTGRLCETFVISSWFSFVDTRAKSPTPSLSPGRSEGDVDVVTPEDG
jgi:hypothetical protein